MAHLATACNDMTGGRPAHITVIGSINEDLVVEVPSLASAGETILGADLVRRSGGKGANQAVAVRRHGVETTLVAAIGDDETGIALTGSLVREGIDTRGIVTAPGRSTGLAFIAVAPDGENSIIVSPGANEALGPKHVATLGGALGRTHMLLLQLEIPIPTSLVAAARAKEHGVTVVLNASPLPDSLADLDNLLGLTDVLVVNESEALRLASEPKPTSPQEWTDVAGRLRSLGPRCVVITLGSEGAVARTDRETHVQPAFSVAVEDTTGAGDSFLGAFAVSLASRLPVDQCLRTACAAGALATTRLGAQEAMPTREQLTEFLGSFPGR